VTEEENTSANGNACDLLRTNTFTITQSSATSAALIVEFNSRAKPGGNWHADCDGPTNWWADELNKTVRMKINLTKQ
jgi:hypothetical protein